MSYFIVLKGILYLYGSWIVGSFAGRWHNRRTRPCIKLKRFDPAAKRWFTNEVGLQMPKGKNTQFFIDDRTTGLGDLTNDPRAAAKARALGKDVYVFNFDRYNNFIQFKSCNASVPGRNYNFLTNTFEGLVNESKDVYVQYFPT